VVHVILEVNSVMHWNVKVSDGNDQ